MSETNLTVGNYFNAILLGGLVGTLLGLFLGIPLGLILTWLTGPTTGTTQLTIGVLIMGVLGFFGGYSGSIQRTKKDKLKNS